MLGHRSSQQDKRAPTTPYSALSMSQSGRDRWAQSFHTICFSLPTGGARNPVDPRFMSLFNVFEIQFPSSHNLSTIYQVGQGSCGSGLPGCPLPTVSCWAAVVSHLWVGACWALRGRPARLACFAGTTAHRLHHELSKANHLYQRCPEQGGYMCAYAHTHAHLRTHARTHTHAHTHTHTYACMHAHTHAQAILSSHLAKLPGEGIRDMMKEKLTDVTVSWSTTV